MEPNIAALFLLAALVAFSQSQAVTTRVASSSAAAVSRAQRLVGRGALALTASTEGLLFFSCLLVLPPLLIFKVATPSKQCASV